MNKISVIVPVYNAEKYLQKCIRSILAQTYKDFELILVNDGSTDSSLDICNKYKKKDKRVKVIEQENKGSIKARQNGIEHSKCEYIIFVDADDWIDKKTLEIVLDEIEKTKADVVVFNMYKVIGKHGLIRKKTKSRYLEDNYTYTGDDIRKKLVVAYLYGHPFPGNLCGKIYKKEYIKGSGKYLDRIKFLGDDLFYNLEIFLKIKKVRIIKDHLYYYRAGGNTNKYMPYLFSDMVNGYRIQKEVIEEYFKDDKQSNYNGSSIMLLNTFKTCLGNIFFSDLKESEIKSQINKYLDNEEIKYALNNEGTKKYFSNEFIESIKNKNTEYLYNLGNDYYKKLKLRRKIIKIVNQI